MELAEEQIRELIEQLQDHHYGARFIALGKLIEAGTVAVPALTEALYYPDKPLRVRAACALAGIGATDASVVMPLIDLWEETRGDAQMAEVLVVVARQLAIEARTEHLRVLLRLLACRLKVTAVIDGVARSAPEGQDAARIAATALTTLARRSPTPHLHEALPLLPHSTMWGKVAPEFDQATQAIKEALGESGTKNLPRPSGSPEQE